MPEEKELAGGEAQRVGPATAEPSAIFHRGRGGSASTIKIPMRNHFEAFNEVMKIISSQADITPDAAAHRVVHGGAVFNSPTLLSRKAVEDLESVKELAPIHNPPAMELIHACTKLYPDLPQVAVFDTAFHSTIPEHARTYAIPAGTAEKFGIRKYGFHGTSHQFVAEEAAKFIDIPMRRLNAVSCHLGSGGASLCAIKGGRSIDNTMGFSPLQGLVMSTRSGDLDPAIALNMLAHNLGDADSVEKTLNNRSGVLGLSGKSADIRDIIAARGRNADPDSTLEVYLWRIKKYLGAYLTTVGRADAVIFTDTIGETMPHVRWAVCSGMEEFGIILDSSANENLKGLPGLISAPESRVKVIAVATNEELAIARRSFEVVARRKPAASDRRAPTRGH